MPIVPATRSPNKRPSTVSNMAIKVPTEIDLGRVAERVGVPFVLAMFVMLQLLPRIDRGVTIAERVEVEMNYLATVGCAPRQLMPPP